MRDATLPPDLDQLERYLAGASTPTDLAEIQGWLDEHPEERRRLQTIQYALRRNDWPASTQAAIADRAQQIVRAEGSESQVHRRGFNIARATAAAMGIVAVLVLGVMVRPRSAEPRTKTYMTAAAQRAHVRLGDGARAVLGPRTAVVVTASATEMRVTVTGEALFQITSSQKTPFVVVAGNTRTRVLGTTFLVRRYAEDRATQVLVVDGRVGVGIGGDERASVRRSYNHVTLGAGMLGLISDSGQVAVTSQVSTDRYLAWTRGELAFHQTPAAEIAAELSQAYGTHIHLGDSTLATRRLTWTVPVAQQTLTDVLDALADALDAHYRRAGDSIVIVAGPAHVPSVRRFSSPFSRESQYGK